MRLRSFLAATLLLLCSLLPTSSAPPAGNPSGSLVVCDVDGKVYTLDAWSGDLRGLFISGPATVSSSTHPRIQPAAAEADDAASTDDPNSFTPPSPYAHLQVVPGLDGLIYMNGASFPFSDDASSSSPDSSSSKPLTDPHLLRELPVSVLDAVTHPGTVCRPPPSGSGVGSPDDCGLLLGERRTKLFALDVSRGSVRWSQLAGGTGGGGADGSRQGTFTRDEGLRNHAETNDGMVGEEEGATGDDAEARQRGAHGRPVMLQREDYVVREVDVDSGEERWNVTVSHFSILDVDLDAIGTTPSSPDTPVEFDSALQAISGSGGGGSRPNSQGLSSPSSAQPLPRYARGPSGQRLFPAGSKPAMGPTAAGLPRIVHMRDGASLAALDPVTGETLWRKTLDSTAVAFYGVSDGNRWVGLDVVAEDWGAGEEEEEEDFEEAGDPTDFDEDEEDFFVKEDAFALATRKLGGLVSFRPSGLSSSANDKSRLGSTSTGSLFITSVTPFYEENFNVWLNGESSSDLVCTADDENPLGGVKAIMPGKTIAVIVESANSNLELSSSDTKQQPPVAPPSSPWPSFNVGTHRTDEGLFLTWSMLVAVVIAAVVFIMFSVRLAYSRLKKRWIERYLPMAVTFAPPEESTESDKAKGFAGVSDSSPGLSGKVGLTNLAIPHLSLLPPTASASSSTGSSPGGLTVGGRSISAPTLHQESPPLLPLLPVSKPLAPRADSGKTMPQYSIVAADNALPGVGASAASAATPPPPAGPAAAEAVPTVAVLSTVSSLATTSSMTTTTNTTQPLQSMMAEINGIPLLRYSRYSSEFTEKQPLGRGGFGTVYRCTNNLDGREYAIKKIPIDSIGSDERSLSGKLKKVLREVKILALLDHPNIVRYYTAWLEIDTSTDANKSRDDAAGDSVWGEEDESKMTTQTSETSSISKVRKAAKQPAKGGKAKGGLKSIDSQSSSSDSNWPDSSNNHHDISRVPSADRDLGFNWERSSKQSVDLSSQADDDEDDDDDSDSEDEESELSTHDMLSGGYVDMSNNSSPGRLVALRDKRNMRAGGAALDSDSTNTPPMGNVRDKDSGVGASSEGRLSAAASGSDTQVPGDKQRHILYIQMQYCSQKTLRDFLSSPEARMNGKKPSSGHRADADGKPSRKGESPSAIDTVYALGLFGQVARGVKHVHSLGLIHRDLKPSNCFVDTGETVKIGDFGLSRESSSVDGLQPGETPEQHLKGSVAAVDREALGKGVRNTAGVGTYMYASPEQMASRDYDASTDVYSLGIMLFEMVYPMYTAMERAVVLGNLHKGVFSQAWTSTVAKEHPDLHRLVCAMISHNPSERPTSENVAKSVDKLLGKLTVLSLDRSKSRGNGAVLLRVEARDAQNSSILPLTKKLIEDAGKEGEFTIEQYGVRGHEGQVVIEFAIAGVTDEEGPDSSLERIFKALSGCKEITAFRRVQDKSANSEKDKN